ncbi:MAG TPA: hypothetical protein PLW66_15825, partial [Saprospiraceae bacterium]|nr:hypothetical protein [Saprospiraceae bacterium]
NAALDAALRDLKDTQAQLVHSEKMAAIGQLTGGVMHEINNPNAAIYAAAHSMNVSLDDIETYFFSLLDDPSKESRKARHFSQLVAEARSINSIAQTGSERIRKCAASNSDDSCWSAKNELGSACCAQASEAPNSRQAAGDTDTDAGGQYHDFKNVHLWKGLKM